MKMTNADNAEAFEAQHPIELKHPETDRSALYLSRAHTQRFDGMSTTESLPLILSLTGICTRIENTLRVKWTPNSLVIWDNLRVMQKASNDYHGERRHMMRMIVQ